MNIETKEVLLALERVGLKQDAIRWLLGFAQEDFQKGISKGSMEDLLEEIRVFSLYGSLGLESLKTVPDRLFHLLPPATYKADLVELSRNFSINVTVFQSLIFSFLKFITNENDQPSRPSFRISANIALAQDTEKNWVLSVVARTKEGKASLKDAFAFNAMVLFSQFAHLIRKCPDCPLFFLANRPKQLFCSNRCLARSTQQTLRDKLKSRKKGKAK